MDDAVVVNDLRKRYGATTAVDGVSFAVRRGEIFGIVGPNGAGKTTAVECLSGLRRPDGGTVEVLGLDPARDADELRQRIGVQLQHAVLPGRLKVWEALDLYSSFYRRAVPIAPLLEQWGLAPKRNTAFASLSGGQKQRLFISLALVNDPELVVLDELTTGLDPQARRATWDLVRAIRDRDKTVVLVTHFMDEAERLCDRVAVIAHGRVVALDTPAALIGRLPTETCIRFTGGTGVDPERLRSLPGVTDVRREGGEIAVTGSGSLMARIATALADQGIAPPDLRTEQSSLEDVFISLTGNETRG